MKKAFYTTIIIIAIIAVRMILSVTFSEQSAEVFYRVSISSLFFYLICSLSKCKCETVH